MDEYVWIDIEADGLLDTVSKIHVLVIDDLRHGLKAYSKKDVAEGVCRLKDAVAAGNILVAHNGIGYDFPVLQRLCGLTIPIEQQEDTLVLSKLIYPDITRQLDESLVKQKTLFSFPKKPHSLEAWGLRLKEAKGDFKGPWEVWSQDMEDYCVQDVKVLRRLHEMLHQRKPKGQAVWLEHRVAAILTEQEHRGVVFNTTKAVTLYTELLKKKLSCENQLKQEFRPFYVKDGKPLIPKQDNKRYGYVKGCVVQKVKVVDFNPGSRDHIANRLITLYGWQPKVFTPTGRPEINETVINGLMFPCKALLAEYLKVTKLIGMIAEGDNAWLKLVKYGRIHGRVNPNGAVTGRATHHNPNLGQVPRVGSSWGAECRELFEPVRDKVMVGCDGSGLELRCLAHRMSLYDDGAYAKVVIEGSSDNGTDVHSINTRAIGFELRELYNVNGKQVKGRDIAKTFIYAFLYGAGDEKIGSIVGKSAKTGKALKTRFLKQTPALAKLLDAVKKASQRGWLKGLDGRIIPVRSQHSALNTLLQSDGAILAKRAMVYLYDTCKDNNWDANQLLWVHDEFQYECHPDLVQEVGEAGVRAWQQAGEFFNYRVPITGEYKSGTNWKETH